MALGNHVFFGKHIAEVWDADLKENVFEFYSHINFLNVDNTTTTDNEPVGNVAEKQRNVFFKGIYKTISDLKLYIENNA